MISRGLTNAECAARLSVTVHAIKFHLSQVYRKLGVSNRTEAAVEFQRLITVVPTIRADGPPDGTGL
jgi:DNA-binding CsgD family transcriptional regulator